MARILIADDEQGIREIVRKYGEYEGFTVLEAKNGEEALKICREEKPDVMILDIMMSKKDGFTTLSEIRNFSDCPVIMLSARGEEYDRLHGFELGADDYVVKPFSPRELIMRVKVAVSRSTKESPEPKNRHEEAGHECYRVKGFIVDYTSRKIYVDGCEKDLTFKEYELLVYLIANKNIALTRDQILSAIWGYDYYGEERTLDTHIKMLRSCMGPYRDMITTLRGVGYRFDEEKA